MQVTTEWDTMKAWLDALNPQLSYTLKEEFRDGQIGTHWNTADTDVFSYEELVDYVSTIWLPSHPAELIICPTSAP